MKKIVLILAALTVAFGASAQPTEWHYEDAIQVDGKAEKKVTPDQIYVSITLRDGSVKGQSVNQLESRMKSELAVLGVDVAKNLKVTSQNLAPRKKTDVDTFRNYELLVGDVWKLGSVFELLGEMNVADAYVSRVTHSQIDTFRDEVRVEAVKNARSTAKTLAAAVGQSIGAAVWIADNGYYENAPLPMYKTRMVMAAADTVYAAGTAEQGLDMQDITITYNISAKFILNRK